MRENRNGMEDAQRDFGGGMISLRGIIEESEWET